MDRLNYLTGQVRRCVDDYGMIVPGDSIAVGISGGKDSLMTLLALRQLQRYHPAGYTLHAITIDSGFPGMDFSPVARWCEDIGVPYTLVPTDIREVVFDIRKEPNPCSLCAKLRKGALNNAALSLGCKKVALGHHWDDAVNTYMMSMIYEGRLSCFQPVTDLDRTGVTQIRPLLYVREEQIRHMAEELSLPVVRSTCPNDTDSKRREIQALVYELEGRYPDFRKHVFGGMQRLPLPGWRKVR